MQYYNQATMRLTLGSEPDKGGEATVYNLQHDSSPVSKLYPAGKCLPAEKLQVMVNNPPDDPTRQMDCRKLCFYPKGKLFCYAAFF